MYTVECSDVIHCRSAPALSSTCEVQLEIVNELKVPFGQVTAATPSVAATNGLLTRKIRLVSWIVPVEPRSISASPPPRTLRPGCCRAASMISSGTHSLAPTQTAADRECPSLGENTVSELCLGENQCRSNTGVERYFAIRIRRDFWEFAFPFIQASDLIRRHKI